MTARANIVRAVFCLMVVLASIWFTFGYQSGKFFFRVGSLGPVAEASAPEGDSDDSDFA